MFRLSLKYFQGLYFSILFLIGILLLGTYGYMYLEQYTFVEGFYMTLITVSTVGFGEVKKLNADGMIFTSFLILSSFGTFAYAATTIARNFLSGNYRNFYKSYKLSQMIANLKGHTIVCGFGNNGEAAVSSLIKHHERFVVIERDEEKLEKIKHIKGALYIVGDATDENNIVEAGINKAKALITTLPSDANNVFVCLTARQLNPKLKIISRATGLKVENKLKLAGANSVIMPDHVGGSHMASLVSTPDLNEFLDRLSIYHSEHDVNLDEFVFHAGNKNSHTVQEIEEFRGGVLRVIGIKGLDQEYRLNPDQEQVVENGEKIFVLGDHRLVEELKKEYALAP
ncbi:potassium channel family protein [bacterium SCSIO 12741]|nr:potassium channel family protein [bacterium SCSIO 12741]